MSFRRKPGKITFKKYTKEDYLDLCSTPKTTPGPSLDAVVNKRFCYLHPVTLIRYNDGDIQEYSIGVKIIEKVTPRYPLYPSGTIMIRMNHWVSAPVLGMHFAPIEVELDLYTPYCISSPEPDAIVCVPQYLNDETYYIPAGDYNRKHCYSVMEEDKGFYITHDS